ncbi:HlyD family secretion protein [Sphingomonas nostoxanthinifaciens]|uniref:HlyD family secretion protein n=1 Tax=Sphingomonas nostoxanthinifaciens TaxID=2872652 RepID=UPI001CC1E84B|nr:HlyD family secretion protein [Sphingomonas nostoxanthinifaciens]UAK26377.1 HlyD family secretion protein [Sphingomonas nostoxanthinifaciens]
MAERKSDDQDHPAKAEDRTGDNGRKLDREGGSGEAAKDDGEDKGDDKPENDKPPLYKRPLFWIVGGIVLALLIVGGILYWLHARRYVSTDDAFVDAHIVRLSAQTSGKLVRVPDYDNRHVPQGQLLAVIEPGTPAAQLEEAQASVAQADAQIQQSQARVISAQATLRQQAANAIAPAAQALHASHDYQRYAALQRLDPAAAAATQVEQARTQAESNNAQALAAQRQVDTARADVAAARKEVKAGYAQRAAALARVREAEVVTSYLRVVAPVAGQVVNRQVNVGSYVAPGQQLMALVPETMWVTANFKETQLKNMRPGQHVDLRIDAYPGVVFAGHIDSIQNGAGQAFALLPAQNATGNYVKVVQRVPVRILFDGAEWRRYAIGPGMSVVPRVTVR